MLKRDTFENIEKEFSDKVMVAVIGKTGQGKTVATTLLYDTIFNYYYPKHKKQMNARVLKGFDILEKHQKKIFGKGRFPAPTLPGYDKEIIIELISKVHPIQKIELIIKDVSGEDINKLLGIEYKNTEEMVIKIINAHKESREKYGPLTYLIFSKIYILLIDCSKFDEWWLEQQRLAQIITAIKNIKEFIGETRDNKFNEPIAIIFTKYDKLNNDIIGLSCKKLLAKYLPALESSIDASHNGEINYFKMQIEGIKATQGKEAEEIRLEILDEMLDEKNNEQKINNITKIRDRKIKQRMNEEYNKILQIKLDEGLDDDSASKEAKEESELERARIETSIPTEVEDTVNWNDVGEKHFKIQLPVKYSDQEFTRFIAWIMEEGD